MRGQLSISFVIRIALGLVLITAVAYATLGLEESLKKESQKQTLVSVAEYTATRVASTMQYLQPGQSANATFRVPMSRDYWSGQYSLGLSAINGVVYVEARSAKWPDMVARQPLFLGTGAVDIDTTPTFPPALCVRAGRNETHYTLSVSC